MKKYLVILIALVVLLTGCGKKEEEKKFERPKTLGNENNVVIEYKSIAGSVAGSPTDRIVIYTDKKADIEHTDKISEAENRKRTVILSEKEYQEIIDLAFQERFMTLNNNLTTEQTEGGSVEYITIYYDKTSRKVGGQNIENETFKKLEKLIIKLEEK